MSRRAFGGDVASFVVTIGAASAALTANRNAVVTMWSAATGGTQYTDLKAADGTTSITSVTALNDGLLPQFFGPDGVPQMWANAPGAAERVLLLPTDATAAYVTPAGKTVLTATALPFFNVKDFGAVGDGVTNDTANVTAAITAAGAGRGVYFPPGTYLISGPISPLTGQVWEGNGAILKRANAGNISMITGVDLANVTFRGLIIDGNRGVSTATSESTVFFTRLTDGAIDGCRFQNIPNANAALEIRGGSRCRVVNNGFSSVGYGVIVGLQSGSSDPCNDFVIAGNNFATTDSDAIFVTENIGSIAAAVTYRVTQIAITGNVIRDCGDSPIEVGSGSSDVTVTGNVILDTTNVTTSGILLRGCRNVTVAGNTVRGCAKPTRGDGIAVVGLNAGASNCIIEDNVVTNCARFGFSVPNSTDAVSVILGNNYFASNVSGNSIAAGAGVALPSALKEQFVTGGAVFTTTTVLTLVAVPGLTFTYTPLRDERMTVVLKLFAKTSAAGIVAAIIDVSPAPPSGVVQASVEHDDFTANTYRSLVSVETYDLTAGVTYTFTGKVYNGQGAATTSVHNLTTVTEMSAVSIPR